MKLVDIKMVEEDAVRLKELKDRYQTVQLQIHDNVNSYGYCSSLNDALVCERNEIEFQLFAIARHCLLI